MAIKVASLYAEIGADTSKLKSSLNDTKRGLSQTKVDLANFAKGAGAVGAGIIAVGAAFQQAMEFGKEGAQLDYARSKFEKLSLAAGVTADTMLGKLRTATRGLRSDAELMGSAGDFMALGLAKTGDEVVRLTRVAGALNMDMNQLVLTLTNQTTMRFDALGVSVDGFDQKVADLKKTGMDTNAAFKEAFLQQAEAQINKIGDSADSSLAPFARLETASKNLGDTIKTNLAPSLADAADAAALLLTRDSQLNDVLNKHSDEVSNTADSYKEYITEMRRSAALLNLNIVESNGTIHVLNGVGVGAQDVTDKYNILNQAQFEFNRMAGGVVTANEDIAASSQNVADAAAEAARQIAEEAQTMQADLIDATNAVRDAQQNWADGAGSDVAQALEAAGLKGDKYREALGFIDDAYGTGLGVQQDYKDDVGALAKNYAEGKITGDEFKTSLGLMKDEYLPLNEEVQKANDQLFNLQAKWLWFKQNNKLDMEINIKQNGSLPGQPGDMPSGVIVPDTDTGKRGRDKFASGTQFVIGGGWNENFPIGPNGGASSGETVTVTPKGQAPGITIMQMTVIANDPQQFSVEMGRQTARRVSSGGGGIGRS